MRMSFGGLLALLSMTLTATALGCAPGDDAESSSAEEGEDVVATARSPSVDAAPRFEASSLSYPHRLALADATMAYLDDALVQETYEAVSAVMPSDERAARDYFVSLRSRIQALEAYLSGTPAAITLVEGRMPYWDTANGVPTGLRAIDPRDDGTSRGTITYPDHADGMIRSGCTHPWMQHQGWWTSAILHDWMRTYITDQLGNPFSSDDAPAAVIYWPLHVVVAQQYEIWESCHVFPSHAVVDDDLSGWTVTGPGAVSLVSDDGGAPWSNVFRVDGAPTGTTTIYRDVAVPADSVGRTAMLPSFARTSSVTCEYGRARTRLSFFNGSSLISMTTGEEGPYTSYKSSLLTATVPAGTTKIRMTILVEPRPANLACTGQHATIDDVRLLLN